MEHPRFCVYVLYSLKDHKFYIGYTTNFKRRVAEHEQGKTKSTAPRRPFIVMMCEYFRSKQVAMRRENYLKSTKGRRALKLMLCHSVGDKTLAIDRLNTSGVVVKCNDREL
ncbi:MAG TPA: GIY-YIG nuclease family protein [Bacteroidia bacterium]|nr:GIY-YIG nuclease family protein [Bacteroidia bacterium]